MLLPTLLAAVFLAFPLASAHSSHSRRSGPSSFPHIARDESSLVVAAANSSVAVSTQATVSTASTGLAFSPPFYPSPNTTATGAWATAVTKAQAYLKNWTIEQKLNITFGF